MRLRNGFILIENIVALSVFALFVGTFVGVFGIYSHLYQQGLTFQRELNLAQNMLELSRDGQSSSDLKLKSESGSDGTTKLIYSIDVYHPIELWIK